MLWYEVKRWQGRNRGLQYINTANLDSHTEEAEGCTPGNKAS